jgi:hypothetical protein
MSLEHGPPGAVDAKPRRRWIPSSRWKRGILLFLLFLGGAALALGVLAVSSVPEAEAPPPRNAAEVRAGERLLQQISRARRTGQSRVQADARSLSALAAVLRPRTGFERMRFDLQADRVTIAASEAVFGGHWINFRLTAVAGRPGPAPIDLSVGRLDVPRWANRPIFWLLRLGLRARGADLPPLEKALQSLTIVRGRLSAELRFPQGSAESLGSLDRTRVDPAEVLRLYCRLEAQQKSDPQQSLAVQVRRAFAGSPAIPAADSNRAAFVALAMLIGNGAGGEAAGVSAASARRCARRTLTVKLRRRADLAEHWTLSAALAAVHGPAAADTAGQWKELADTEREGSGFSFVDLAADRSGVLAARLATDSDRAAAMRAALSGATEDQLLPEELLALPEGLTEAEFRQSYGHLADPRFRAQIRAIDAVLGRRTAPAAVPSR